MKFQFAGAIVGLALGAFSTAVAAAPLVPNPSASGGSTIVNKVHDDWCPPRERRVYSYRSYGPSYRYYSYEPRYHYRTYSYRPYRTYRTYGYGAPTYYRRTSTWYWW